MADFELPTEENNEIVPNPESSNGLGFELPTRTFDKSNVIQGDVDIFRDRRSGGFTPTGGLNAIRQEVAIAQTAGEQLINSTAKMIPAIGLGIIENAGYLLELPEAFGETKDFRNAVTDFAISNRQKLDDTLPVFRENPNEVFDIGDSAWWIQHGAGLFESIGEFLVTGVGVGKALGGGAKALNNVLNLGKTAGTVTQAGAALGTSATLAYTEGAMSGAQVYKDVYADAIKKDKDHTQANQIASESAAQTVKINTVINTALNLTSVAPLFSKNLSRLGKIESKIRKGETNSAFIKRLNSVIDDPTKGFKPNAKAKIVGEVLQEGVEEQVNLFAEGEGRLKGGLVTEEEAGGKNALSRFLKSAKSEEGILNFILGGIGGAGQTVGVDLASKKANAEELKTFGEQRIKNLNLVIDTVDKLDETKAKLAEAVEAKDDVRVDELRDELFDIGLQYHFIRGSEDALIGTMREVAGVDNEVDLGEEVQKDITEKFDNVRVNQEELQQVREIPENEKTEEDVALEEQLTNEVETELAEIKTLEQQRNLLLGKTDAILQGLTKTKKDNTYIALANKKIEDIEGYQQRYVELEDKYNNSDERANVDVASTILNKEILRDGLGKEIDYRHKEFTSVTNSINDLILEDTASEANSNEGDAFVNDLFLLEGKLQAAKNLKQGKNSKLVNKYLDNIIKDTEGELKTLRDNSDVTGDGTIDEIANNVDAKDKIIEGYTNEQQEIIGREALLESNNDSLEKIKADPDIVVKQAEKETKKDVEEAEKAKNDVINKERANESDEETTQNEPQSEATEEVSEEPDGELRDRENTSGEQGGEGRVDKPQGRKLVKGEKYNINDLDNLVSKDGEKIILNPEILDKFKQVADINDIEFTVKTIGKVGESLGVVLQYKLGDDVVDVPFLTLEIVPDSTPNTDSENGEETSSAEESDEELTPNETNERTEEIVDNEGVPESYQETNDFSNSPSKDVDLNDDQLDTRNVNTNLTVNGASSIANQVKGFTSLAQGVKVTNANALNPSYPVGNMVEGNHSIGDEVVLEIDKEFKVVTDGVTQQYSDYENDPLRVPIKITKKSTGELLGYLHTIDYMNPNSIASQVFDTEGNVTVEDNISLQKETITSYRNHIVESGGKVESKINLIDGNWALSINRIKNDDGIFLRPTKDVFKNKELTFGVIGKEGVQSSHSTLTDVRNSSDFLSANKGKVVVVLPSVSRNDLAIPLRVNKVNDSQIDTLLEALTIFSKKKLNESETELVDSINQETELDISTLAGVREFIEKHLLATSLTESKSDTILKSKARKSRRYIDVNLDGGIVIQQENRSPKTFNEELSLDDVEEIRSHIKEMYVNIVDANIGNLNFSEVTIERDTNDKVSYSIVNTPYNDFLKRSTQTDVHENSFTYSGKQEYSYFDNPIYEINVIVEDAKPEVKEKKEASESKVEPVEPSTTKKPRVKSRSAIWSDDDTNSIDTDNDETVTPSHSPLTSEDQDYNEFDRLRELLSTDLNIAFTPKQIRDIVDSGYMEIVTSMKNKFSRKESFDFWKEFVESESNHNDKYSDRYKLILDNISEINQIISDRIERENILTTELANALDNDLETSGVEDKESVSDKAFHDSDENWKKDNKFSASDRLKSFLGLTLDKEQVTNKKGDILYSKKIGYLGTPTVVPIDVVFNTLKEILADTGNKFEDMLAVIKEERKNLHWLDDVYTSLNNKNKAIALGFDHNQIKNEFVTIMSNSSFKFKTVLYTTFDNGDIVSNWINSDRVSAARKLLETFRSDVKDTDLYDIKDNEYTFNKEEAQNIIDWYNKQILNNKEFLPTTSLAKEFLSKFNIEVSDRTIELVDTTTSPSAKDNWTDQTGIYRIFYNRLQAGIFSKDLGFEVTNPLNNNSSLEKIVGFETRNSDTINAQSHKNEKGNIVNTINQNRNIITRIDDLKNKDSKLAKELVENVPFLKLTKTTNVNKDGSTSETFLYDTILARLARKDGKVMKNLKLALASGINQKGRGLNGTLLNEQTERQLEATRITAFRDNKEFLTTKDKYFNYVHEVPNKNTAFTLRMPLNKVGTAKNEDGSIKLLGLSENKLYGIVLSEINRMNAYQDAVDADTAPVIQGYKHDSFYFFDTLNELKDSEGNPLNIILNGRVALLENGNLPPSIKKAVIAHIQDQFNLMVNDKLATWRRLNIVRPNAVDFIPRIQEDKTQLSKEQLQQAIDVNSKNFAIEYVFNNILGRFDMHQLVIGDPALFSKVNKDGSLNINDTYDNLFKRLTKDQAPGTDYAFDKRFQTYIQIALADVKLDALNLESIPKEFRKKYKGIEITDAQEFITVQEGLVNLLTKGDINEADFQKYLASYNSTGKPPKIAGLFQPQKPIYSDKRVVKTSDGTVLAEEQVYVKSSAIVLSKELTTGTPLDILREGMEALEKAGETQVRASFKSANKLGGGKPVLLVDKNGEFLNELEINPENYAIHNRSELRVQQDIPYDENKDDVIDGTQQRTLIQYLLSSIDTFLLEGDGQIDGKKLLEEYNKIYQTMFSDASDALKEDLSSQGRDGDSNVNITKVSELLTKEAKSRNWSTNALKGLAVVDGKFKIPLYFNANSNKIESLLGSIVNNKVLKNKRRGKSLVLATEVGFNNFSKDVIYTSEYNGQLQHNQIIVPSILKIDGKNINIQDYTIVDEDGVTRLDESKIPKELLQSFGYRIPTQGYNSMASLEIVGFFPAEYGDRVIASRNLITQMGSDFDVDKLFVFNYDYSYDKATDTFSKLDSVENKLLDIELSIMSHPSVMKLTQEPLTTGNLQKISDGEIVESPISKIYDGNRLTKYLEAQDGGIGIGVFATNGKFLSNVRHIDGVYHRTVGEDETLKELEVGFDGKRGNRLSDKDTIEGLLTKLQVNSYFLSASVDNEKDPILGRLNLNKFTFPAVQTLIGAGFNETDIANFIKQPVIRDWVQRYQELADDSINEFATDAELEASIYVQEKLGVEERSGDEAKYSDIGTKDAVKQLEQLDKFLDLRKLGRDISTVKSATNSDSKYVPKSMIESIDKENMINELYFKTNDKIRNAYKILGEYKVRKSSGLKELVELNSISGSTSLFGVIFNNELWKQYFDPYSDALFTQSVKEIESITGTILNSDQKSELFRNIKSYKIGEIGETIINGNVTEIREELTFDKGGKKNLNSRLKKIKDKYPNSPFFYGLSVISDDNPLAPTRMFYNNVSQSGIDPDFIQNEFNERLLDKDTREFMEDLIKYQFITDYNHSAGSILNLIPIEYYEVKGVLDKMNTTRWNNSAQVPYFLRQFIQNNPKYGRTITPDVVKKLNVNATTMSFDISKLNKSEIRNYRSGKEFTPYVSTYNKKSKGYLLFVHAGGGKYNRINILGYKGVKEYDATKKDSTYLSSYLSNNVSGFTPNPQQDVVEKNVTEKDSVDTTGVTKAYISNYDTSSFSNMVDSMVEDTDNVSVKEILKLVSHIGDNGNNPEILTSDSAKFKGQYDPVSNTITINSTLDKSEFEKTFVHEVIHSQLDSIVSKKPSERTKKEKELLGSITGIQSRLNTKLRENTKEYAEFKEKFKLYEKFVNRESDEYLQNKFTTEESEVYLSSVNTKEFVANLFSSELLQNELNGSEFTEGKTLMERIAEVIRRFYDSFKTLGSNVIATNSELEQAISNVIQLLEGNETYKGLPVIDTNDIINSEGNKGAALYDRVNKIIKVDRAFLKTKFEEKAWTNPRTLIENIDGSKVESKMTELPESQFKTYEGFEKFVIEHERQHSLLNREQFNKLMPFDTTTGMYEDEINNRALIELNKDDNIVSHSPLTTNNTYGKTELENLEKYFNLRNNDGSRKRIFRNQFKKTHKRVQQINRELSSQFIATRVQVQGEKGDRRTYDAIQIVLNDKNVVSFSPLTEEDRITVFINQLQKDISNLKSKLTEGGDRDLQVKLQDQVNRAEVRLKEVINQSSVKAIIDEGVIQLDEIADLFDNDTLSYGDLTRIHDQLALWSKADTLVLDDDTLADIKSPDVIELKEIINRASQMLQDRWVTLAKKTYLKLAKERGINVLSSEFYASEPDIGKAKAEFLNIGRSSAEIVTDKDGKQTKRGYTIPLIDRIIVDTDTLSTQEYNNRLNQLHKEFSKFKESTFFKNLKDTSSNPYDVFAQVDADGNKTGYLVNRISNDYFKEIEGFKSKIRGAENANNHVVVGKLKQKYYSWIKANNITADPRAIVNSETLELKTQDQLDQYIKNLAHTLGGDVKIATQRAKDLVDNSKSKIKSYVRELEAETRRAINLTDTKKEADEIINLFKEQNSPFLYFEKERNSNFKGWRFIANTPVSKWNDKNFDKINSDSDAREFYRFFIDSMNDLHKHAPDDVFQELQYNHLPYYPKSLMEKVSEEGVMSGLSSVPSKVLDLFREKGLDNVTYNESDRIGATTKYDLVFPSNKLQNLKTKGERTRAIQDQTFDLEKILKIYTISVLTYKNKKAIEDQVRLGRQLFDFQEEVVVNDGSIVYNKSAVKEGVEETKNGGSALKNKKEQMDYYIARQFYGVNPDKSTLFETKKKLTSDEKKTVKELEQEKAESLNNYKNGEIEHSVYVTETDKVDAKIQKIGKPVTGKMILKNILDYVRLRGMGYNIFSGITNMNVAFIGNMIHASGSEEFTVGDLMDSLSITINSMVNVLPGLGGGAILGTLVAPGFGTIIGGGLGVLLTSDKSITGTGKKLNKLMGLWEVLGDITEENPVGTEYNTNEKKFYERFGAFEIQRKSEYFSQSTTLVALMMNTKIKNKLGEEVNLWNAYDKEGNWKTDEFSDEVNNDWNFTNFTSTEGTQFFDFKRKLSKTLAAIHGDYTKTSALKINKTVFGQALMQFRRWIPEGASQRFENYQFDEDLGRHREGRWRVLTSLKAVTDSIKLFATFNKDNVELNGYKDHEIANLKKNVAEIQMYLGLLSIGVMTKLASDDDDDEMKYISNFTLNQIFRLQADLEFYFNPMSFEQITKNAIPAFNVIGDVIKVIDNGERLIFEDNVHAKTREAFWLRTAKLFPAGSASVNTYRATQQLFSN